MFYISFDWLSNWRDARSIFSFYDYIQWCNLHMDYISMIRVNHPGIYFYSVVLGIILKLFTFVDENIHRKKS